MSEGKRQQALKILEKINGYRHALDSLEQTFETLSLDLTEGSDDYFSSSSIPSEAIEEFVCDGRDFLYDLGEEE